MTGSPFIPGAEVAITVQNGWRAPISFKFGKVAKVNKRGNFTLEGSPQQYRPYPPSSYENYWHAAATGTSNATLRILDDTTRDDIREKCRVAQLYKRFTAAREVVNRESFSDLVTDIVVEKLEFVAAAIKPAKVEAA